MKPCQQQTKQNRSRAMMNKSRCFVKEGLSSQMMSMPAMSWSGWTIIGSVRTRWRCERMTDSFQRSRFRIWWLFTTLTKSSGASFSSMVQSLKLWPERTSPTIMLGSMAPLATWITRTLKANSITPYFWALWTVKFLAQMSRSLSITKEISGACIRFG